MKAIQFANKSDSILTNELPVIATQTVKVKTITQKRKELPDYLERRRRYKSPILLMKCKILIIDWFLPEICEAIRWKLMWIACVFRIEC